MVKCGTRKRRVLNQNRAIDSLTKDTNMEQMRTLSRTVLYNNTPKRRPPKSAAVTITDLKSDFFYSSALKTARENICLRDMGIESTKIREAVNGGLIIEILGKEGHSKADNLAVKLKRVLTGAIIRRLMKKADIRLTRLDDSTTTEEISYIHLQRLEIV